MAYLLIFCFDSYFQWEGLREGYMYVLGFSSIKRGFCILKKNKKTKNKNWEIEEIEERKLVQVSGFPNQSFSCTILYFVILKASNENVSAWDAANVDVGCKTEPCKLMCRVSFMVSIQVTFLHYSSSCFLITGCADPWDVESYFHFLILKTKKKKCFKPHPNNPFLIWNIVMS